MLFIPIYRYRQGNKLLLSTHIDAQAKAADQTDEVDKISLADFILNNVVTYPHTVYKNIFQVSPASITTETADGILASDVYWVPKETNPYKSMDEVAIAVRKGLEGYIERIT